LKVDNRKNSSVTMKVNGEYYRTIWIKPGDKNTLQIIDQRRLPYDFIIEDLATVDQVAVAIKDMHVRGAGLIGATAGYGIYIATLEALNSHSFDEYLKLSAEQLLATRPTAVNLEWAINRQLTAIKKGSTNQEKVDIAYRTAIDIADEDAIYCRKIGEIGLKILKELSLKKKGGRINILTHCNAGWLAFVDFGTATSPIYAAFDQGMDIHVWIDETRPRNQGARLTAWELNKHGVPHTVIADNVGGHLMQKGLVDVFITGADRVTYTGDVANKIGTYLKALAAKDNNIPFYVAFPSSTFDWKIRNSYNEIPIEERNAEEVQYIEGLCDGKIKKILLTPEESPVANFGFDITPSRLITGLITERGICNADEQSILHLFPKHKKDISLDVDRSL
jgi:methylthioribose-1-phosphate isomerase